MNYKELFDLIESERYKAGYTLKAFCDAIGTSKTSYRHYRNGSVNMGAKTLLNALDVLGIRLMWTGNYKPQDKRRAINKKERVC